MRWSATPQQVTLVLCVRLWVVLGYRVILVWLKNDYTLVFVNIIITDQQAVSADAGSVLQQQIVTFEQGGDFISSAKPAMTVDKTMAVSAHEARVHGLLDFFQRPILLERLQFTQAQGANSLIGATLPHPYIIDFPYYVWQQPMWSEKLKGFRFVRYDLVFKFLVNGSPFDLGRLLFFWSPFDAERGDRRPFLTRTNCSGYPSVEVDIGKQMTSELRIPYVSMFTHIDQAVSGQPYGGLRCMVLSALKSTIASNAADISIYCHLENVDLTIPTDIPVFATNIIPQVREYAQSEGIARDKQGIISGSAKKVGAVAKLFANLPVVGDIAKPVGWIADATAGVASLLGFSKPNTMAAPMVVVPIPAKNFTHTDGMFNGVVVGAKPDNEIKSSYAPFGTQIDEMNITNIVSRANYMETIGWPASSAATTLLWKVPVHAGICGTDVNQTGADFTSTHMSYVASMFEYWRGGVTFRFTAVKNQYYSGRLVFVFFPGITSGTITSYTSRDISKCYQWVWDIKQDTDLELTIPYQSNLQFLRTKLHDNSNAAQRDGLTLDTVTGTLACFVDNQLRAPSSVVQGIEIQVWVKGAHDLTFAVPDMLHYVPVDTLPVDLLPTSPSFVLPPKKRKVKEKERKKKFDTVEHVQMMKVEDSYLYNQREFGKQNPEGSSLLEVIPGETTAPELNCIGEIHNNIRPLTRRMTPVAYGIQYASGIRTVIDPAYFFAGNKQPLNYISFLYAFYRGSTRYMARITQDFISPSYTPPATTDTLQQVIVDPRYWSFKSEALSSASPIGPFNTIVATATAANFQHMMPTNLNPIIEVTLPYYANVPMLVISKTWITPLHLRMTYSVGPDQPWTIPLAGKLDLYKAAGDDHSFGYMVGAPLMSATGS